MKTAGEGEGSKDTRKESVSKNATALLRAPFMSWWVTTLLSGPPSPDKDCLSR